MSTSVRGPSAARPAAGTPPAAGRGRQHRRPVVQRILGTNPLGWLFSAPYLVFVIAIFAFPLCFSVYMSFFDYFFAAPGANVDRPFVGLANYTQAFSDPAVLQSFVQNEYPKTWNHELRVSGKPGGALDWQAGYYHFKENSSLFSYNAVPGDGCSAGPSGWPRF